MGCQPAINTAVNMVFLWTRCKPTTLLALGIRYFRAGCSSMNSLAAFAKAASAIVSVPSSLISANKSSITLHHQQPCYKLALYCLYRFALHQQQHVFVTVLL